MPRTIVSRDGTIWLATPVPNIPVRQQSEQEVSIACKRCDTSRGCFESRAAAQRDGWTEIQPYNWPVMSSDYWSTHRGLCSFCHGRPEEEARRKRGKKRRK